MSDEDGGLVVAWLTRAAGGFALLTSLLLVVSLFAQAETTQFGDFSGPLASDPAILVPALITAALFAFAAWLILDGRGLRIGLAIVIGLVLPYVAFFFQDVVDLLSRFDEGFEGPAIHLFHASGAAAFVAAAAALGHSLLRDREAFTAGDLPRFERVATAGAALALVLAVLGFFDTYQLETNGGGIGFDGWETQNNGSRGVTVVSLFSLPVFTGWAWTRREAAVRTGMAIGFGVAVVLNGLSILLRVIFDRVGPINFGDLGASVEVANAGVIEVIVSAGLAAAAATAVIDRSEVAKLRSITVANEPS